MEIISYSDGKYPFVLVRNREKRTDIYIYIYI